MALDELAMDVARANRILERFGLSNAFGHASARLPDTSTFLLPTRRSPGFADAGRLLTIDFDGRVVAGDGEPNSEHWIHGRIYAARPDVMSVVHFRRQFPQSKFFVTMLAREPARLIRRSAQVQQSDALRLLVALE